MIFYHGRKIDPAPDVALQVEQSRTLLEAVTGCAFTMRFNTNGQSGGAWLVTHRNGGNDTELGLRTRRERTMGDLSMEYAVVSFNAIRT